MVADPQPWELIGNGLMDVAGQRVGVTRQPAGGPAWSDGGDATTGDESSSATNNEVWVLGATGRTLSVRLT
jgi:hypothetical protein